MPVSTMGERIRYLRKKLSLSQHDLSKLVGISDRCISAIERGTSTMKLSTLQRLSAELHATPSYIAHGDDPPVIVHLASPSVGGKIKALRVGHHLSVRELEALIHPGCCTSCVSAWEAGRNVPMVRHLLTISSLFNVNVESFLD